MQCDPYEVLRKVVRIANCTALDYPRSFKGILRFLVRRLNLQTASFLLLDNRQRTFVQRIGDAGADFFAPEKRGVGKSPEGAAIRRRQPIIRDDRMVFPVFNARRNYGVLILQIPSASEPGEELIKLVKVVCDQLAMLAEYAILSGEEHRRVTQLTLLSELGMELNRALTLKELLPAAVRTVLHHSGAACVILRPLLGDTVLGRSYVRVRADYRSFRPLFLDLEEESSARALATQAPVFRQGLPKSRNLPGPPPPAMVAIPLLFQEQMLGTLTLFGGGDQEGVPLVYDREAQKLFTTIGNKVAQVLERVSSRERLETLSVENDRKFRETQLLYRISRAMHSTLRLNEVVHLILSAATVPDGGGFERAMLFTINERSGILQGMLGVTRQTASLLLPEEKGPLAWVRPALSEANLDAQRQSPFCRQVMKQRLLLDQDDNCLARAALTGQVIQVADPEKQPPSVQHFAEALGISSFACAPLPGKERTVGVLVVDNPESDEEITPDRLRFLGLFANQAAAAIENSMLLHRLETTHQELRETQERLIQGEKLAALGEMAASVAHEIKNPLVSIGGFAQRLARIAEVGSRESEYAGIIAREVRRMESLLTDVLDFSKNQLLCFSPCRVEEIIEKALALESDALGRAMIDLRRELMEDLPPIKGDDQKLLQVMINLVANARQVMPDGGTLTVKAYRGMLRGDDAVVVEVSDTGGGIPAEAMANIFNPFFTTKEQGTGLGLSISHRIVEQHLGEIEAGNTDQGAVFIVRLPTRGPEVLFREMPLR